jgi:SAM-dependent methyltransferase
MLLIVVSLILLCFAGVLLFGAPYVPTLKNQQQQALKLLDLKKGQTLLELGCGDGRVLRAAAKQGIYGVGYELNPIMFMVAKLVTFRYRKLVTVYYGNFWAKKWPPADGIYVFLLDKYMENLHKKINQERGSKPVKVVSFAFEIPHQKPIRTDYGLFLYEYKV